MPTTGLPGADPGLNERRGCGWSPPENFEFVDAHRHIMGQQEGGCNRYPSPPHPLVDLSETVTVRLRQ